jgi:hypothetical protein
VYVRVGRYSTFVEQGERTASLVEDTPPDEVLLEVALRLLEQAQQGEEPLEACPETGKPDERAAEKIRRKTSHHEGGGKVSQGEGPREIAVAIVKFDSVATGNSTSPSLNLGFPGHLSFVSPPAGLYRISTAPGHRFAKESCHAFRFVLEEKGHYFRGAAGVSARA